MVEWKDEMTLYHGSYCSVPRPELEKCAPYKDFGLGFYVTTSKIQAERFVATAVKKAMRGRLIPEETNFGYVSVYRFRMAPRLRLKEFQNADAAWLHCIAAHRKGGVFTQIRQELAAYDIIAGKIANDQTNATLIAYLAGLYGELGTEAADTICIRMLLPERLENQICLRTEAALSELTFMEATKVWLNKP